MHKLTHRGATLVCPSARVIFELIIIIIIIIIIIGIQLLGRFGHKPELSQATGMALVRCILGKFLGVVCHCFPPDRLYPSGNIPGTHFQISVCDEQTGAW